MLVSEVVLNTKYGFELSENSLTSGNCFFSYPAKISLDRRGYSRDMALRSTVLSRLLSRSAAPAGPPGLQGRERPRLLPARHDLQAAERLLHLRLEDSRRPRAASTTLTSRSSPESMN